MSSAIPNNGQVVTNHVPRDVILGSELTPSERVEFDYLDWKAYECGFEHFEFFRYKGELYDLSQFEVAPAVIKRHGFDGMYSTSYFSAVVVQYFDRDGNLIDDGDRVIVGTWSPE